MSAVLSPLFGHYKCILFLLLLKVVRMPPVYPICQARVFLAEQAASGKITKKKRHTFFAKLSSHENGNQPTKQAASETIFTNN